MGEIGFNGYNYGSDEKMIKESYNWRGSNAYFKAENHDVRGTMSLSALGLSFYAFEQRKKLDGIFATTDQHNRAAQQQLQHLGFKTGSFNFKYRRKNGWCQEAQGACKNIPFLISRKDFYATYVTPSQKLRKS